MHIAQGYHVTCVHVISLFILMIPADLYWIQRLKTEWIPRHSLQVRKFPMLIFKSADKLIWWMNLIIIQDPVRGNFESELLPRFMRFPPPAPHPALLPPIKTDLIRLNAISILHIHARKSALYLALFIFGEYNWHKLGLLVGPREDLGQGKFPIRV